MKPSFRTLVASAAAVGMTLASTGIASARYFPMDRGNANPNQHSVSVKVRTCVRAYQRALVTANDREATVDARAEFKTCMDVALQRKNRGHDGSSSSMSSKSKMSKSSKSSWSKSSKSSSSMSSMTSSSSSMSNTSSSSTSNNQALNLGVNGSLNAGASANVGGNSVNANAGANVNVNVGN